MRPPNRQMQAASIRNCSRMVRRLAPMALRTPISRVRSATETNMMFMMPMPPTNSDRLVTNRPMMAMVRGLLVKHVHNLVLLVDGKIVRLVRARGGGCGASPGAVPRALRPAAPARWLSPGSGQCWDVSKCTARYSRSGMMTRLSRLPAQHAPLFFQHADDLKGLVVNFDAFAERGIRRETDWWPHRCR